MPGSLERDLYLEVLGEIYTGATFPQCYFPPMLCSATSPQRNIVLLPLILYSASYPQCHGVLIHLKALLECTPVKTGQV